MLSVVPLCFPLICYLFFFLCSLSCPPPLPFTSPSPVPGVREPDKREREEVAANILLAIEKGSRDKNQMARRGGLEKPKASKNGIVYTRDFEVVEMNELNLEGSRSQFTTTSYAVATPHIGDASRPDSLWYRSVQSFKRADAVPLPPGPYSFDMNGGLPRPAQVGGRSYDLRAANVRVANSALSRDLKGRHLQMIAISGSVGMSLLRFAQPRSSCFPPCGDP